MTKKISILGSTGSIGTQSLDVIREFKEIYTVIGLSAGQNISLLKKQIIEFSPKIVCIQKEEDRKELIEFIHSNNQTTAVVVGNKGLLNIASESVDLLIVALVGTTGIMPTFKALQEKNNIALACKEVLVSAGDIIMTKAKENNISIIPIDSEHAAIKQCLESNHPPHSIEKVILTASGGPFWEYDSNKFNTITVNQALKHPKWSMGNKISIDSATLVNKGLEIMEAHHLFNISYDKIDVLIHRQSIVHGIVEFIDGNILAHLSPTDMRFPIQYAITYPQKLKTAFKRLDFKQCSIMTFEDPNHKKFPLLPLAIECGIKKGSYPVVFNAANEAAVSLFLKEKISFLDIHTTIENQLNSFNHYSTLSIEDIIDIDRKIKHDILSNS
ncbi:1-deoxy-D-xylulose-5-phosphate reductoisomerase [Candidatus Marinamargulisbacteria bacterium SCGC AG-343-D04]|nr:1-deoxy-D-xylulose-5-phosphate reductoisomerase [Candidatus Marinamargulisbacteria bacterium SCGC AG-343-D04]